MAEDNLPKSSFLSNFLSGGRVGRSSQGSSSKDGSPLPTGLPPLKKPQDTAAAIGSGLAFGSIEAANTVLKETLLKEGIINRFGGKEAILRMDHEVLTESFDPETLRVLDIGDLPKFSKEFEDWALKEGLPKLNKGRIQKGDLPVDGIGNLQIKATSFGLPLLSPKRLGKSALTYGLKSQLESLDITPRYSHISHFTKEEQATLLNDYLRYKSKLKFGDLVTDLDGIDSLIAENEKKISNIQAQTYAARSSNANESTIKRLSGDLEATRNLLALQKASVSIFQGQNKINNVLKDQSAWAKIPKVLEKVNKEYKKFDDHPVWYVITAPSRVLWHKYLKRKIYTPFIQALKALAGNTLKAFPRALSSASEFIYSRATQRAENLAVKGSTKLGSYTATQLSRGLRSAGSQLSKAAVTIGRSALKTFGKAAIAAAQRAIGALVATIGPEVGLIILAVIGITVALVILVVVVIAPLGGLFQPSVAAAGCVTNCVGKPAIANASLALPVDSPCIFTVCLGQPYNSGGGWCLAYVNNVLQNAGYPLISSVFASGTIATVQGSPRLLKSYQIIPPSQIQGASSFLPGDLVVWGGGPSPFAGHIAIVISTSANFVFIRGTTTPVFPIRQVVEPGTWVNGNLVIAGLGSTLFTFIGVIRAY